MANFLRQLVENDKRELRRLGKLADKVIALESQMSALEDADFPVKTEEYKARYAQGESLDALLALYSSVFTGKSASSNAAI